MFFYDNDKGKKPKALAAMHKRYKAEKTMRYTFQQNAMFILHFSSTTTSTGIPVRILVKWFAVPTNIYFLYMKKS